MKTTSGKTKTFPRTERRVQIFTQDQCVGYVVATGLRNALEVLFKNTLRQRGFVSPLYTGNILTVALPNGPLTLEPYSYVTFTALEVRS